MKRILSVILTAALFISTLGTAVFAAENSGECGENLTWFYSDDGTLTISGTGDMDNTEYGDGSSYTSYVWIDDGYEINSVVLSEGITSIGAYAFEALERLTSVVIPEGVTRIGMGAFQGSGITSVTLPSTLKQIDMGAFYDCPVSDVYFSGTSDDWLNMDIDLEGNDILTKTNIHVYEKAPSQNTSTTEQGIGITFGNTPSSDKITVKLNGSPIAFDVPPQIINDRTMVPLRAIFEALGAEVEWNGETQTISATRSECQIGMMIGGYNIVKITNGTDIKTITLDTPPVIVNERTLVPVRAIAESFNCTVNWDGETRTVDIWG